MTRRYQAPRRFARLADFTIFVVCVEAPAAHPDWKDKEWARSDDPEMVVSHNQSYWEGEFEALRNWLAEAARRIARRIQANEGGVWLGRLRDAANDPRPDRVLPLAERHALDTHILSGPDGPGRRFLENLLDRPNEAKLAALAASLRAVPRPEPYRTTAPRAMIERMKDPIPPARPTSVQEVERSGVAEIGPPALSGATVDVITGAAADLPARREPAPLPDTPIMADFENGPALRNQYRREPGEGE
jgi:hypothetical protein